MNKRELIDKAIEEFGGVWHRNEPTFDRLVYTPDCDKHFKIWQADWFNAGGWTELCTKDEFEQRARELGWINGFKYGVEYETNGNKPDLPDDLVIECFDGSTWWGGYEGKLNVGDLEFNTYATTKFRIVDERYKPKSEQSWFEKDELPPVGSFVDVVGEVRYGAGETNCEVIAHVENCAVIRMSYGLGCFESHCLKPTKTEREKFIDAASVIIHRWQIEHNSSAAKCAEMLYDANFRAPE
ncbi:MAG: hypothetical protein ACKO7M_13050 [Acinetobacter junii]